MNKLILFLFLLPLVTTTSIYSGETFTLDVTETYDLYSIVGNSTNVKLNVTQIGNTIYITPNKYSNDNFELIFFNKEKEVITISVGSGGSGGSVRYIDNSSVQYIPIEVVKLVETEIEKEVEVETNKIPLWIWVVLGILGLSVALLLVRYSNTDERRYKNEQENFSV